MKVGNLSELTSVVKEKPVVVREVDFGDNHVEENCKRTEDPTVAEFTDRDDDHDGPHQVAKKNKVKRAGIRVLTKSSSSARAACG